MPRPKRSANVEAVSHDEPTPKRVTTMVEEGPGGLEGPGDDLSTRDGLLCFAATAPKDLAGHPRANVVITLQFIVSAMDQGVNLLETQVGCGDNGGRAAARARALCVQLF